MRKELVLCDAGDGDTLLEFEITDGSWSQTVLERNPQVGLKELADFCDQNAESRNNHVFTGLHRLLSVFFAKRVGVETATLLMREIAERGGCDGMTGLYWCEPDNDTSSFEDFGIEDYAAEWSVPE